MFPKTTTAGSCRLEGWVWLGNIIFIKSQLLCDSSQRQAPKLCTLELQLHPLHVGWCTHHVEVLIVAAQQK